MPPEKKQNVDINSLFRFQKNGVIGIGIIIILLNLALRLLQWNSSGIWIPPIIITLGAVYLVFGAQRFNHYH